jgi:alpha-L-fucosidase 2
MFLLMKLPTHKEWWRNYWDQSSVSIPDPILEKQWYLEIYKFGLLRGKVRTVSLQQSGQQ